MFKDTAGQFLTVFAFDSLADGQPPKTGDAANITANVAIDDGAPTALAAGNTASEISPSLQPGYYLLPLAQVETNGDKLGFAANSSTHGIVCIAVPAVVYPVALMLSPGVPLIPDDATTIVQGDTYADGTANPSITFTVTGYDGPAIAGATVKLMAIPKGAYDSGSGTAEQTWTNGTATLGVDGTLTMKFAMTATETAALTHTHPPEPLGNYVLYAQLISGAGAVMTEVIDEDATLIRKLT